MSDDLILYSNLIPRGWIARWMLEEVGEPYQVISSISDQA